MKKISLKILFNTLGGLILGASVATASQSVRDAINPALIEKQLDAVELIPQSETLAIKKVVPKEEIPQGASKIKLRVQKVIFTHGHIYNESKLQTLAAPYIGCDISLSDLYKLAEDVTRLYREDGYLLSRAVIPPQSIDKNGVIQIQIVEGFVDTISYEGEKDEISDYARSFADRIKDSRPLNAQDLERYLLLMRDLPGLQVEAILKPSATQPQASDLVIVVKRKKMAAAIGINNEGSKYIGPYMANAIVDFNSFFGQENQLTLQTAITQKARQLKHGHAVYTQFIGSEGTKLTFGGSWTKTKPEDVLKILGITGETKSLALGVQHPFIRSRSQSFYGGLHFTMRNVQSGLLDNTTLSKDKLRSVSADLIWDMADRFRGVNLFHFQVNKGLRGFGETRNIYESKSRTTGRSDFTKVNLEVSRLQGVWGNFSLYGIVEGQYAFNPLLSSERFIYGGSSYFRAYTDGPISGDTGVKEKIELRYGDAFLSNFLQSYQAFGFYGYGTAWNQKGTIDERKRTSAPEVGGGVRFVIWDTSCTLEYVRPLKKYIGIVKYPSTLFFSLSKKF